jgi:predicted O-methyltransferase YrrM
MSDGTPTDAGRAAPASDELDRTVRRTPWGELAIGQRPDVLATPEGTQREWLVHRLLSETAADVEALDEITRAFVEGSRRPLIEDHWEDAREHVDEHELVISGQQVMQAWETPLMDAMADAIASPERDVLELGFGMGISATALQRRGVRSHTIVEPNADVLERGREWAAGFPDADIRFVEGRWQEVLPELGQFDAIFYDTYPITEDEFLAVVKTPFPIDFLEAAPALLRPGGVLTHYTNEIDSLSRWHQRVLLRGFTSFTVSVVDGLEPPPDCNYWWAPTMALVVATR